MVAEADLSARVSRSSVSMTSDPHIDSSQGRASQAKHRHELKCIAVAYLSEIMHAKDRVLRVIVMADMQSRKDSISSNVYVMRHLCLEFPVAI